MEDDIKHTVECIISVADLLHIDVYSKGFVENNRAIYGNYLALEILRIAIRIVQRTPYEYIPREVHDIIDSGVFTQSKLVMCFKEALCKSMLTRWSLERTRDGVY